MRTAVVFTALVAALSLGVAVNAAEQVSKAQFDSTVVEGKQTSFVKFYGAFLFLL